MELEAGAFAGADIVGLDGVVESADGADDGNGAVLERVDLVEAAGFVARGHEEHVGAGLDAVRHVIVVSDLDGEAARILADETAEEILVILVSGAENDDGNILVRQAVGGEGDEIEALLGGKARDDADDGRGGFRVEREAAQQIAAALAACPPATPPNNGRR